MLSSASVRRGVRGELLTNGYQSLRDQGKLIAVKVNENGEQIPSGAHGHSKNSQSDLQQLNVCIEKSYIKE